MGLLHDFLVAAQEDLHHEFPLLPALPMVSFSI